MVKHMDLLHICQCNGLGHPPDDMECQDPIDHLIACHKSPGHKATRGYRMLLRLGLALRSG